MEEKLGMVVSLYERNVSPWGQVPEKNDEIFLCGDASDVWEYLRDVMGWFSEPKAFNPSIHSIASWRKHGAIILY